MRETGERTNREHTGTRRLRHRRHRWAVLLVTLALLSPACAMEAERGADPRTDVSMGDASVLLQDIADRVWERRLEEDPFLRMREGLPVEQLRDLSYEGAREDAEFARTVLERLELVEPAELTHQEVLTREILEWESELEVEGLDHFYLESVLTPYSSPLPSLRRIFEAHEFDDPADLEAYVDLVSQVPGFVETLHDRAREQLERGIVVPGPNLDAVVGLVDAAIRPPSEGPYGVDRERLSELDLRTEARAAFRDRVATIVREEINPALRGLRLFLDGEYRAAAPDRVGVSRYPGGEAYYRYLVRLHTTMETTPEAVQEAGREMVSEMESAMAGIRRETGFEGSREEFRRHLRRDPRFYPESPEEVAERLMDAAQAFEERVDRYFLETPEAGYAVERLDPSLEGSQTYGYYRPPTAAEPRGVYHYNGSDLDERSWLNLRGVALHELVPGHHFQIARQQENDELPAFRTHTRHTAFTEGWGSYASLLGLEAGIFEDDPYSRYGLYALEVFLASRLVVDPGMNAFDWSLERAREYMGEHTLESDTQIATETLRYSTDMPGQALAYQMGKREIVRLRRRAEEALGDDFDLRRFHEAILDGGSMPMTVLEQHVDWFIERERRRLADDR